ncbi:MAG: glycerophosphodiester phosphodiesterase [Betaproteobacteria bacterium]|nr:glycerophosphodiester phosphodiesterase [Betaproteobacteria bacterium]
MQPFPLPRWIAHRGGGSLAPENTLAGIRLAARMGFRAVEFDVMLTADGTPVLIHDETLERTTNGTGRVCDASDAAIFALDAGGGEPVPRFDQAAALCRELGLLANVEIKPAAGHEIATAEVVARMARTLWRGDELPPLFSSFSLAALRVAHDVAPDIPRGVLWEEAPADWRSVLHDLQAASLHCNATLLTDAVLDEAREHGISVLAYTVNEPERAHALFARGVSAVFTDRLDLFSGDTTAYDCLQLGG